MATILYFAALRDLTASAEEQREIPSDVVSVRQLVAYLQHVRPELAGRMGGVRVALDEAFADDDSPIAGAQVIALIPPVSGG